MKSKQFMTQIQHYISTRPIINNSMQLNFSQRFDEINEIEGSRR